MQLFDSRHGGVGLEMVSGRLGCGSGLIRLWSLRLMFFMKCLFHYLLIVYVEAMIK